MDKLYVETSIISHVTARLSSDLQVAAIQQQARDWWLGERSKFDLVTSQLVIAEVSDGDESAAAERLKQLEGIPLVPVTADAKSLADSLISATLIPEKAAADALHVAVAAVAGVKYLLTQNCRHIANAHILPQLYRMLRDQGYQQLLICTPVEFLGGDNEESDS